MNCLVEPASAELFYSRGDPDDPRLGERVHRLTSLPSSSPIPLSPLPYSLLLLGIPDDRGIEANHGRPGAREAPDAIRRVLYRFTLGAQGELEECQWGDLGNLCLAPTLAESHARAIQLVQLALAYAERVITLGGGHDYAYCDLRALLESVPAGKRIGVVNLDAHLDVRPDTKGINSGTAFYRLLKEERFEPATFVEFGIQPQGTARSHLEFVRASGAQILFWDQIADKPVEHFAAVLQNLAERCDWIGLSLDLDCVQMGDAPGVSAPSPMGFRAEQLLQMVRLAATCSKVRTLGVFEVSPPLDVAESTVRLAALCVYEFARTTASRKR